MIYSFKSRMNREDAYVLRLRKCFNELAIIANNGKGFISQAARNASNIILVRIKEGVITSDFAEDDLKWFLGE